MNGFKDEKPRVALVFNGLGIGGVEKVGVNYAKLFLDLNYDVDVYNLQPEHIAMVNEFDSRCNITSIKMPDWLIPDRYMLMVKRWRWGKYLYPPVYVVTTIMLYAYRLLQGRRKKYDLTVAFAGHLRDLTFVAKNFVRGERKLCWLHGALADYLLASYTYGDLYRNIKNLCVLSRANEISAMESNRYLKTLNITQIYNPMMTQQRVIDEQKVANLKDEFGEYLLMVGRFAGDKDQKTVILAMKELVTKYHRTEKMVFVGDGSTIEECKKLTEELGLQNQIIFVGARYDVQNYYVGAKLFVHSSPVEGLPTVLLEAMNYNVPIVATDSQPGVGEILRNDVYGVKCEVGDPVDMAEKINDMLTDDEKRQHYIYMGQQRVKDFSEENIRTKLKDIIEKLQ